MRRSIPLVCPACRAPIELSSTNQHFLVCNSDGCGARYPIVDGVPILVENWPDYARSERWIILRRHDLMPEIDELLNVPLGDEHAERIRNRHLATYLRSHYGEPLGELAELARALPEWVHHWLMATLPPKANVGLDAGCATGGLTAMLQDCAEQAIGIDLHFERVHAASHRVPNATFLVANAEEPPLEKGSVAVALALNLIDGIAHPRVALENLKDCIEPGGLLLLTTPFDYSTIYSQRQEWLDEDSLSELLAAFFDILDDRARVPWVLPVTDRHADVFFVRAIAARKRA